MAAIIDVVAQRGNEKLTEKSVKSFLHVFKILCSSTFLDVLKAAATRILSDILIMRATALPVYRIKSTWELLSLEQV